MTLYLQILLETKLFELNEKGRMSRATPRKARTNRGYLPIDFIKLIESSGELSDESAASLRTALGSFKETVPF